MRKFAKPNGARARLALRLTVLSLVGAAVVHLGAVWLTPYAVLLGLQLSSDHPRNHMVHVPPITAAAREVVRPSPDLLYSACPFDLADGPLLVEAPKGWSYFSVAGFADNTDNFFVVNDLAVPGELLRLVVIADGDEAPATDAVLVRSPSRRGLILIRRLIDDPARLPELQAIQAQASCRSW